MKIEKDLAKNEFVTGKEYTLADVVATVFLARIKMVKTMLD